MGSVIAGILSSLEPINNNTWFNLVSDLAENIFTTNKSLQNFNNLNYYNGQFYCNDYLKNVITLADIYGSIDGFLMGNYLNEVYRLKEFKLSKILEMYYQKKNGIFLYDRRACNRFSEINKYVNISIDEIKSKISYFANELQPNFLETSFSFIDKIESHSYNMAQKFNSFINEKSILITYKL